MCKLLDFNRSTLWRQRRAEQDSQAQQPEQSPILIAKSDLCADSEGEPLDQDHCELTIDLQICQGLANQGFARPEASAEHLGGRSANDDDHDEDCSFEGRVILAQSKPGSKQPKVDEELADKIHALIQRFPTWGYRRLCAWLRHKEGIKVNKKKIRRIIRIKGWTVNQRILTPRPRVKGKRSRANESNERWAIDATHIHCGRDGWAHLIAVIDCHDREIVGYHMAMRGRAKEAEMALEEACLNRFGLVYAQPGEQRPVLRSDNGLIFLSRRFRAACGQYGLSQEFITPHTPQQNGMIERFFRSLKEECVWLCNFRDFREARREVERWIEFYNTERPHQSLGYLSPAEFISQKVQQAA